MRSLLTAALLALPPLALAQGSLTPTGAPAASMKSLDQIEARTPIGAVDGSSGTLTIKRSGSYVLLGNVAVTAGPAIAISTSNVTLDLNGFTLSSTDATAASDAITVNELSDAITIRNGHIMGGGTIDENGNFVPGPGFASGLYAPNSSAFLLENITVTGVGQAGLFLAASHSANTIRHCAVTRCGGDGLAADVVVDSSAIEVYSGIRALQVANCRAECHGSGSGIEAGNITNSTGISVEGSGISGETVTNCVGDSNEDHGIAATTVIGSRGLSGKRCGILATTVTDCDGSSRTGPGISATHTSNSQGSSDSDTGLLSYTAINSSGNSGSGTGLHAFNDAYLPGRPGTAENCGGISDSGDGLIATIAMNCVGTTNAGNKHGILVEGTANSCRGTNTDPTGGAAIKAAIAVACTAAVGRIDVTTPNGKQLGTP
ncbi:MAG: right-handed parallel beta-helix repeat-containing protein [Opitutaceae bacterium]|nr:right-handed parallel beta-helix repeat-containing protein [Opitutaceae bacterium]